MYFAFCEWTIYILYNISLVTKNRSREIVVEEPELLSSNQRGCIIGKDLRQFVTTLCNLATPLSENAYSATSFASPTED